MEVAQDMDTVRSLFVIAFVARRCQSSNPASHRKGLLTVLRDSYSKLRAYHSAVRANCRTRTVMLTRLPCTHWIQEHSGQACKRGTKYTAIRCRE